MDNGAFRVLGMVNWHTETLTVRSKSVRTADEFAGRCTPDPGNEQNFETNG